MPPPRLYFENRRRGITLLELLAAMAISALVFAVLLAVYFTVIQTVGRQAGGRGGAAAADALDTLARDFMCAMAPDNITNLPLTLEPATNDIPGMICRFYTAEPWSPDQGPWAYVAREVQIQMQPAAAGGYALERIRRPLPGAADATNTTRDIWQPLRAMDLAVYDGESWNTSWAGEDLPRAVRLNLTYGDTPAQTLSMEIPIPAGIPFGPTNAAAPGKQMPPDSPAR